MGRRGARRAAGAVAGLLTAFPARGQHCEPPNASDASSFRAVSRAEAGHFESGERTGWYEGIGVAVGARVGIFRGHVRLPYYRLLAARGSANGFGDVETKLELAIVDGPEWSLGGAFSASFPTGSAEKRLGMGHVMLGPSAWFWRRAERVFGSAELGFIGALDTSSEDEAAPTSAHHHHGAASTTNAHHAAGGPVPNPMNRNEVWLGLNASYDASATLRLNAGATGAAPTSDDGKTRATLRGGVEFPLGVLTPALGFEVDVLGVTRREVALASFASSF